MHWTKDTTARTIIAENILVSMSRCLLLKYAHHSVYVTWNEKVINTDLCFQLCLSDVLFLASHCSLPPTKFIGVDPFPLVPSPPDFKMHSGMVARIWLLIASLLT
ncbi:hypothetical protein TNIN_470591 [Trichonephila inaurata madagascariensis]|uniref:Uncharacterized protein n=1 Tax=Trichonephila inaurata madagascariensis TaxID=2747483 RepID=A0A8X6YV08_9ARAC|nr:hypothetical protein TNIN_470591 [Trichonephila inaurata madagascariensis]